MALAILILACIMLYMTSKYFPKEGVQALVKTRKTAFLLIASAISLLSLWLYTNHYDLATALVIWITAFMTLLSAIILSVKMNFKWIWMWAGLGLTLLLVDIL